MVKVAGEIGGGPDQGNAHGYQVEGLRDLRDIDRLIRSGMWQIPAAALQVLPMQIAQIATGAVPNPATGKPYSASAMLKAQKLLAIFNGQNIAATRLALDLYNAERPTTIHHVHEEAVISPEQREAELLAILDAIDVESSDAQPPDAGADPAGDRDRESVEP